MSLSSFAPGVDVLVDVANALHVGLEQVLAVFTAAVIHCIYSVGFRADATPCTFTCVLRCSDERNGAWFITFKRVASTYIIRHDVRCGGRVVRVVRLRPGEVETLREVVGGLNHFNALPCINAGEEGVGSKVLYLSIADVENAVEIPRNEVPRNESEVGRARLELEVASDVVRQVLGVGSVPPAVNVLFKYLRSDDDKSPLNVAMTHVSLIADFAMAFIGAPGSGKTTIAYWIAYATLLKLMSIAKQVLGLGIDVEGLDLGRALRALHPRSLEELVNLINYGESCRRLPLLFIDDAVPTWWSINASRVGRQFYSKFMSYYRNWAGMVFMTTQYRNVLKALPMPRYYVTLNTAQGVIEVVWFRRLARAVNTAVGTTNVVGGYTVHKALIPYDPGGAFKLPPDFEEDSRLAKANFRRVYTARELERILTRDNVDCNIETLQEGPTGIIIDAYNRLLRLRESGRLSTRP